MERLTLLPSGAANMSCRSGVSPLRKVGSERDKAEFRLAKNSPAELQLQEAVFPFERQRSKRSTIYLRNGRVGESERVAVYTRRKPRCCTCDDQRRTFVRARATTVNDNVTAERINARPAKCLAQNAVRGTTKSQVRAFWSHGYGGKTTDIS